MSRVGIDRQTGELLTGWAECQQAIGVILTTAIGALPLARDFGSSCPSLQDRPMTGRGVTAYYMAIAEALREWEPCYRVRQVQVTQATPGGVISFVVTGDYYPNGLQNDFSVVETGMEAIAGPFSTAGVGGLAA
jgi:phage baseplate assembly protein W